MPCSATAERLLAFRFGTDWAYGISARCGDCPTGKQKWVL
jgi:hypothetical protein